MRKGTEDPPKGVVMPKDFEWRRCSKCRGWFAAHREAEMDWCYACETQAWLERRRRGK